MNIIRRFAFWLWRWWTGNDSCADYVAWFKASPRKIFARHEARVADFVDSTTPWSVSCRVNDGSGWRTISSSFKNILTQPRVEPLDEEGCNCKITLDSAVGTSFGLNPETGELDPIATSVTRNGKTTVTLVEGPALEAEKEARASVLFGETIYSDPVRLKAEMLRRHMEGCQQGTTP